jgi:hypothetical protein
MPGRAGKGYSHAVNASNEQGATPDNEEHLVSEISGAA